MDTTRRTGRGRTIALGAAAVTSMGATLLVPSMFRPEMGSPGPSPVVTAPTTVPAVPVPVVAAVPGGGPLP